MGFWVGEPFEGDEQVRRGDQGEVAVEAIEGTSLEVVQAQSGLQFAVVMFDAPSHFCESD